MKHYYIYRDWNGTREYVIDVYPIGDGKFMFQFSGSARGLFLLKGKHIVENLMKQSDNSLYCQIGEVEL